MKKNLLLAENLKKIPTAKLSLETYRTDLKHKKQKWYQRNQLEDSKFV